MNDEYELIKHLSVIEDAFELGVPFKVEGAINAIICLFAKKEGEK